MNWTKWLLGRVLPRSLNQDLQRIQNTVSVYQALRNFNGANPQDQQTAAQLAQKIADAEHAYAAYVLQLTHLNAVELISLWVSGGNSQLDGLRQNVNDAVLHASLWLGQQKPV